MNEFVNQGDKATRLGFGEGIAEAGDLFPNLIVLGADITSSVGLNLFAEKYPNRFFSFGIAEQNIAAVAAGLALTGKIPVFSTYGVFAALRAADQIRISICYNNAKVIIGGAHAGISVGPDGATHQALEDIAAIRALPNITLLSPCDANQAKAASLAAISQIDGPVYIRFGREPVPNFTKPEQKFTIGKGEILTDGNDVALIATGHMVWEAINAAGILKKNGVSAMVVNISTIKPIDKELLVRVAHKTRKVITIEEHQIHGGLGSTVAEVLSQAFPVPMKIIGIPDCFGESGTPAELFEKYGLNAKAIAKQTISALQHFDDLI